MCWLLHSANISYGILCGVPGFLTNPLEMNTWKILDHFCFCRLFFWVANPRVQGVLGGSSYRKIIAGRNKYRVLKRQIGWFQYEAPKRYVFWFISPRKCSDLRTINHTYCRYKPTERYQTRAPHWLNPAIFMEVDWKAMESKLVGGWALPSETYESGGIIMPNIRKNKHMFQTPKTS